MGVLEGVKEEIEKVAGWKRPSRGDLSYAVKSRKPDPFGFKDDGVIPNNPKLPFVRENERPRSRRSGVSERSSTRSHADRCSGHVITTWFRVCGSSNCGSESDG